jgi:anti-sigma B factor antagonist
VLFDVERSTADGRQALTVRGELDIATAPQLAAAVDAILSTKPRGLIVDLSPTTFLDSSGARTLVQISRSASDRGIALHVVAPPTNGPVRLTVDLLELHTVVPIVGSAAEIPAAVAEGESRP